MVVCIPSTNSLSPSDRKDALGVRCFRIRNIFQIQPVCLASWLQECSMIECVKTCIRVDTAAQIFISQNEHVVLVHSRKLGCIH